MITTEDKSPLDDLPYWKQFNTVFVSALPSEGMNTKVWSGIKTAYFSTYEELYADHGQSKSPFEYLELLLPILPESARENALIQARTVLPDDYDPDPGDSPRKFARSPRKPKDDAPTKPHKKFSKRFREVMEPTDTKKEEVTS